LYSVSLKLIEALKVVFEKYPVDYWSIW
jgi:hypothetical protein